MVMKGSRPAKPHTIMIIQVSKYIRKSESIVLSKVTKI